MKDSQLKKLEELAESDNPEALFRLSGFNVYPNDRERRLNNLKRASNLGHVYATYILACLYEGSVPEFEDIKNIDESIRLLTFLVENHKHQEAEYMLKVGKFFEGNFDTEINVVEGVKQALLLTENEIASEFITEMSLKNLSQLRDIFTDEVAIDVYMLLNH